MVPWVGPVNLDKPELHTSFKFLTSTDLRWNSGSLSSYVILSELLKSLKPCLHSEAGCEIQCKSTLGAQDRRDYSYFA